MAQGDPYDQPDLDKGGNVPTNAPQPEDNSFKGVSQTPPDVEVDETGTPHRKGSPSGKWSDKDTVKEDEIHPTPAPGQ